MRKIVLILLALALPCLGQLTPQQIENAAAPYRFYSARDLAVADTYLMSVLVGMGAVSPASILASASAWKAFSDRDLQNAQTYLLSQFSGSVIVNAQSTNNGVLSTNGNNILISPNNTIAVFTNASGAIGIGYNFPVGSILGNGIWIGGGGGASGGAVATNGIVIGGGAAASAFLDSLDTIAYTGGGISIGNQVDNFGPYSIIIAASGGNNYLGGGDFGCVFIGNENNDGGITITNVQYLGNRASDLSLKNNTAYIGSPGPPTFGGTTGVVFNTGSTANNVISRTNITSPGIVAGYQLLSTNAANVGTTLSVTGAVITLQANKSALINSNVATSPYLFTNNFGYNVVVYLGFGTNNGIAVNGTFVGTMTNSVSTYILQPNDYLWVTNNNGRPSFNIKPF